MVPLATEAIGAATARLNGLLEIQKGLEGLRKSRDRETDKRWQANFDLLFAQVVAYQVKAGWAGVIIGARRWDRSPGAARWVASAQTPLSQPVPTWVAAVDAHVLGTGTIRGRPVWRISFFDPGTPGWFEIALERRTLRTLETHMITASHFMLDVYSAFNASPAIKQPVP